MKAETCVVYDGSVVASSCSLGHFVIIGEPASQPGPACSIAAHGKIRSHSVIYAGTKIGTRFACGHGVLIREHCEIGDEVSIGSGTVVEHRVRIGNRVRVHSNAFIPEHTLIEDDVWVGPNAVLTNARYPNSPLTKSRLQGVILRAGCVIGANVTILPGVTIGSGALVGAGSVVVKDVAAGVVVAGQPLKVLRKRDEIPDYVFGDGGTST